MKSSKKLFQIKSVYGLVGFALLTLFSCRQPVIDPCDPIESLGDYLLSLTELPFLVDSNRIGILGHSMARN